MNNEHMSYLRSLIAQDLHISTVACAPFHQCDGSDIDMKDACVFSQPLFEFKWEDVQNVFIFDIERLSTCQR